MFHPPGSYSSLLSPILSLHFFVLPLLPFLSNNLSWYPMIFVHIFSISASVSLPLSLRLLLRLSICISLVLLFCFCLYISLCILVIHNTLLSFHPFDTPEAGSPTSMKVPMSLTKHGLMLISKCMLKVKPDTSLFNNYEKSPDRDPEQGELSPSGKLNLDYLLKYKNT